MKSAMSTNATSRSRAIAAPQKKGMLMQTQNQFTKASLATTLLCAAALLSGCVASEISAQEASSSTIITMPQDRYDAWSTRNARFSSDQIYPNVDYWNIEPLLAGKVFVSYYESGGRPADDGGSYGTFRADYLTADGRIVGCAGEVPAASNTYRIEWRPAYIGNERLNIGYPAMAASPDVSNNPGYYIHQYNAETGQLVEFTQQGRIWWEANKGHLQERIPAVVYEICPDFPSAESLGLRVNTAQTSTNYFELIEQDPGRRILRPDLVSEVTTRNLRDQ